MSAPIFEALIYFLGFMGIASIGLQPVRSWQVSSNAFAHTTRKAGKAMAFFVITIAFGSLWCDVQITLRIFKCLTEVHCGPGVASGWIYLAELGVVYLAFEAAILVMQSIARHDGKSKRI